MGLLLNHHTFKTNEKVHYGQGNTSLMMFGVCGNWGGSDTRIRLFIDDVCICTLRKDDWERESNRFPIALALGEGADVHIAVRQAVDPDLTISLRDIRLGRRGG